jgi:hypothetical protein
MPTTLDETITQPQRTADRHQGRSRPMPAAAPAARTAPPAPVAPSVAPGPEVTVRVVGPEPAAPSTRVRARRGFTITGFLLAVVAGAAAVAVIIAVGAVLGLIDIGNPFASTTVDRTPPALLKELKNVSKYDAAEGTFMVRVDVENDVGILPSFIAGEHTLFNAVGTVPATVDFSALGTDAVTTNGKAVTISLPVPEYGKAVVDPARSRVVMRTRGIADRVGDLFGSDTNNERQLYLLADKKIAAAARESGLVARAERNTTKMLDALLGRLGYTDVTVRFEKPITAPADTAHARTS